jgi:hypothetical protein
MPNRAHMRPIWVKVKWNSLCVPHGSFSPLWKLISRVIDLCQFSGYGLEHLTLSLMSHFFSLPQKLSKFSSIHDISYRRRRRRHHHHHHSTIQHPKLRVYFKQWISNNSNCTLLISVGSDLQASTNRQTTIAPLFYAFNSNSETTHFLGRRLLSILIS